MEARWICKLYSVALATLSDWKAEVLSAGSRQGLLRAVSRLAARKHFRLINSPMALSLSEC